MKNTNWFRTAIFCAVSMIVLNSGQAFAQSLDEIIEARPEVTQPVNTQVSDTPAPVAPQEPTQPVNDVNAIRQRIVELAGSKVGTVTDRAGADGFKIGWQNLKEFYEVAYKINDLETDRSWWMKDIKGVGKKVNDWCGIFCIWAWRKAGLPVYWNTKVIGCKYRGQKNLLAPGDIVIMKNKNPEKPLNHHCMIKSINGDNAETIDGNQGVDSIMFRNRKVSDIEILYSVAEAMGQKPAQSTASTPVPASTPKPATTSGQGTTITSKPPTTAKPSTASGQKPASTPNTSPASSPQSTTPAEPLSQKEIDNLISQVMMLIKVTLGQFF